MLFFIISFLGFCQADTPHLTRSQCKQLIINHKPAADVDYQPGIDVKGNPVVPADISPPKNYGLGDNVEIDIGSRHKRVAPRTPSRLRNSDVSFGTVNITKDGKVYINGEVVGDTQREELEEHCRELYPDL